MPRISSLSLTSKTASSASCVAFLLGALYLAVPHTATDADTLSRLALGRWLWSARTLPASDPFTFSAPTVHFGDPEWLGDYALYIAYLAGAERGLVAYAFIVGALGYAFAFLRGVQAGSDRWVMLLTLSWTLPVVSPRIVARNDIHLFWILPAFIVLASRKQRLAWWLLAPLAWVWAHLHSSFVLGLPLLAAGLIDARAKLRCAVPALCAYALLPLMGPAGVTTYAQLYDHARHADIYRGLLSEWQTPVTSGGVLAVLPLHVLCAAALFTWFRERRSWLQHVSLLMGFVLAYSSRRFLPLMVISIAPAVAPAVSALLARAAQRRVWLSGLALCSALYLSVGLRSALRRETPSIFAAPLGPAAAAQFLAAHAPDGTRLANSFDDGPWLTWITAPRLRHYLDPRNNLGAEHLARYVSQVLPSAAEFARETQALDIGAALLRLQDPASWALNRQLMTAPDWQLVYWDGHHAAYARVSAQNQPLLRSFGYVSVRATFDLSYLNDRRAAVPDSELQRLRGNAPAVADLLQAYQLLQRGSQADVATAKTLLESAFPQLSYSAEFLRYWSEEGA
ncbi:MAG: hypothetical protein RL701_2603 [Pseudomonadota bacterium]|jgi:hypothetical protein